MFQQSFAQAELIKSKYGYSSMYQAIPISEALGTAHIEKLMELKKPQETLIISMNEADLKSKLQKAKDEKAEKIYVLHVLQKKILNLYCMALIPNWKS